MTRRTDQYAGESDVQYRDRLESELVSAYGKIERLELEAESLQAGHAMRVEALEDSAREAEQEREFLREQLAELALQIRSDTAPRSRQQMARLIAGLLRGEDWRHGTWRR